eukprot:4428128-Amphidinium_carterae.1
MEDRHGLDSLPELAPADSWVPYASDVKCLDVQSINQTCRFRGALFNPQRDHEMLLLAVPQTNLLFCLLE